ncbi:glycosyltransferase [Pusillimonas sp. MFBS29]|uniref:glycosyltransferase n=1 Tax=Pusillimonas sp. MFBS29 TaxID=2886690 RepID=UPI001D116004|nr:glycosyltransferase [Pusillimonas sp. MFBS29]MCC2596157.1 glycosyltransferase [Pusillimonas sp. MFBS29]
MPPASSEIPFSVLMSLYHKENPGYLHACFNSLLAQTLPATEIVLVFDGPIPRPLLAVVEQWMPRLPIRTVPLPENVGLGPALAQGLLACRYDLVARMDTDDLCEPERFRQQMDFLAQHPELALCGSAIVEIDPDTEAGLGTRTVPLSAEDIRARLPYRNPFNHMTVILRKDAVLAVGNYHNFPMMEDWYLWARLMYAGHAGANLPQCLVRARAGAQMLDRRGGLAYVKSEFLITRYFIAQGMTPFWKAWPIFLARSAARLVPTGARRAIYKQLRGRA